MDNDSHTHTHANKQTTETFNYINLFENNFSKKKEYIYTYSIRIIRYTFTLTIHSVKYLIKYKRSTINLIT